MGDVDYPVPRPKSLIGNEALPILAAKPTACSVRSNELTMRPWNYLSLSGNKRAVVATLVMLTSSTRRSTNGTLSIVT